MKFSLFSILTKKKSLPHYGRIYTLYTDGKGYLYDLRPNGLGKPEPLFVAGDKIEYEESIQTIQNVEAIPPIKDEVIESTWEGHLAYSSSGFFGFRYLIGARIYQ